MIQLHRITLHERPLRTRFAFRYGIASLTESPYLIVRVEAQVDGVSATGLAADLLPPKWFTKDPASPFERDLDDMRAVTRHAADAAIDLGGCASPFALWRQLYERQWHWARTTPHPPLLWHFGVTLIERATIDAFCRATGTRFADAVQRNTLGIDLGAVHDELAGHAPADHLPAQPRRTLIARHTVGLGDPLTDADIPPAERLNDGLPQSLEANIRAYGLTHFKIKVCGQLDEDLDRLRRIAAVIQPLVGDACRFTLDGNEQFRSLGDLRLLWSRLTEDETLRDFLQGLLFIEQPVHRDVALDEQMGREMSQWTDRPAIIIDEADAAIDSLPRALALGYAGTSHKNCKGVFKGIANACLLDARGGEAGERWLSAEDLANVGPIALLQDLAVVAVLGPAHVERNGHHYFRGLSGFPREDQRRILAAHGDLYHEHPDGFAALTIRNGALTLDSVLAAPFGYHPYPQATLEAAAAMTPH